jgi:hypothetical protein
MAKQSKEIGENIKNLKFQLKIEKFKIVSYWPKER